ncbi:hypothetical protein [[Eubacterium] cellulosolvens]
MSEGETKAPEQPYPYYPYYGYGTGYPPPDVKRETRRGVQFLFIGLIFYLISSFFGILSTIASSYFIYNYSILSGTWIIVTMLLFMSGGSFLGFIILLLISLFFFHRGRHEFGTKHEKNVHVAKIFLFIYFIIFLIQLFVLPMFMIFAPLGMLRVTVGISTIFSLVQIFLLTFSILYLIRELVGPLELDLLYIFVGLTIIFSIVQYLILVLFYANIFVPDFWGYVAFETSFEVIFTILVFLAFLAYYRMFKCFDNTGKFTPKESSAFLPRPESVATPMWIFFTRPRPSLLLILVISVMLGAGMGASIYIPDYSTDPYDVYIEIEPTAFTIYEDGIETLQEGDTMPVDLYVDGYITYINVVITWEDEPDAGPRVNQPDTFSVVLIIDGVESAPHTGENAHGDAGVITITQIYEEDELVYSDEFGIEVTLEYAGDQTNPIGIGPGLFNIEDNSNDFYYEIVVEYNVE